MKEYRLLPNGRLVKVVDDKQLPFCEVCGSTNNLERHHWAPAYIFNGSADKWPMSILCMSCHKLWHDRVTPRMRLV